MQGRAAPLHHLSKMLDSCDLRFPSQPTEPPPNANQVAFAQPAVQAPQPQSATAQENQRVQQPLLLSQVRSCVGTAQEEVPPCAPAGGELLQQAHRQQQQLQHHEHQQQQLLWPHRQQHQHPQLHQQRHLCEVQQKESLNSDVQNPTSPFTSSNCLGLGAPHPLQRGQLPSPPQSFSVPLEAVHQQRQSESQAEGSSSLKGPIETEPPAAPTPHPHKRHSGGPRLGSSAEQVAAALCSTGGPQGCLEGPHILPEVETTSSDASGERSSQQQQQEQQQQQQQQHQQQLVRPPVSGHPLCFADGPPHQRVDTSRAAATAAAAAARCRSFKVLPSAAGNTTPAAPAGAAAAPPRAAATAKAATAAATGATAAAGAAAARATRSIEGDLSGGSSLYRSVRRALSTAVKRLEAAAAERIRCFMDEEYRHLASLLLSEEEEEALLHGLLLGLKLESFTDAGLSALFELLQGLPAAAANAAAQTNSGAPPDTSWGPPVYGTLTSCQDTSATTQREAEITLPPCSSRGRLDLSAQSARGPSLGSPGSPGAPTDFVLTPRGSIVEAAAAALQPALREYLDYIDEVDGFVDIMSESKPTRNRCIYTPDGGRQQERAAAAAGGKHNGGEVRTSRMQAAAAAATSRTAPTAARDSGKAATATAAAAVADIAVAAAAAAEFMEGTSAKAGLSALTHKPQRRRPRHSVSKRGMATWGPPAALGGPPAALGAPFEESSPLPLTEGIRAKRQCQGLPSVSFLCSSPLTSAAAWGLPHLKHQQQQQQQQHQHWGLSSERESFLLEKSQAVSSPSRISPSCAESFPMINPCKPCTVEAAFRSSSSSSNSSSSKSGICSGASSGCPCSSSTSSRVLISSSLCPGGVVCDAAPPPSTVTSGVCTPGAVEVGAISSLRSPVKGVYYDSLKKLWRVQWQTTAAAEGGGGPPGAPGEGKRISRSFSCNRLGFEAARARAVAWILSRGLVGDGGGPGWFPSDISGVCAALRAAETWEMVQDTQIKEFAAFVDPKRFLLRVEGFYLTAKMTGGGRPCTRTHKQNPFPPKQQQHQQQQQ